MFEAVDWPAVVTSVSASVTAGAAIYTARRVQATVSTVMETIEANEDRSKKNERLLLGSEAYDGVVTRVERVEEDADV